MLKGIAASGGIGLGRAVIVHQETIVVERRYGDNVESEKARFIKALNILCAELSLDYEKIKKLAGQEAAEILTAQIAIARDPELKKEIYSYLETEYLSAELAFDLVCKKYIGIFSMLQDELMRSRAADFYDLRDQMLRILLGKEKFCLMAVEKNSILVATNFSPSQAALIDPAKVCGITTQKGTQYSHISIIARAMRLPAVVAVPNLFQSVLNGDELVVDGTNGVIYRNPTKH